MCQLCSQDTLCRDRRFHKLSILTTCNELYDTDRLGSDEALSSPVLLWMLITCTGHLVNSTPDPDPQEAIYIFLQPDLRDSQIFQS